MSKKQIRKNILSKMKGFDKEKKLKADIWLMEKLIKNENFKKARRIGIFLSMPHEIDTYNIINYALDNGKQIFVPDTDYKNHNMNFKQLLDLSSIATDDKGINYVNEDTSISNDMDLLIVPGVAFQTNGFRIGYGGGYYDKFLSQHDINTISLIYDFQISDFDVEKHDQPLDNLIICNTKFGRN
ncbi:5-formyltetrahydrofolate cyclo-ligase [Staphylococcus hominis]